MVAVSTSTNVSTMPLGANTTAPTLMVDSLANAQWEKHSDKTDEHVVSFCSKIPNRCLLVSTQVRIRYLINPFLNCIGRACYSCQNAATNEECNAQPLEVCPSDAGACENQVRIHDGITRIFKRCKQEQSCNNNFIQVFINSCFLLR